MPVLFYILALFSATSAKAELSPAVGMRPGYLTDVSEERHWREVEMVLISVPPKEQRSLLGRPLMDAKMTKEFETQYDLKFGRTDAERNLSNSNRFAFFEYPGGKTETIDAHTDRQRRFGEYMVRRLTEHHVDQYAKSNPDIRPIYEIKDKISNVNVEMREGYKLRLHYSYSGNYLDAKLENPYNLGSKITLQMKDGGIGPSRVERAIFAVEYPYSKIVTVSAFHEIDNAASTSVVCARKLTRSLTSTVTLSQNAPVDRDQPLTSPRNDLILVGLSWTE